jgi:hypothetical protein
MTAAIVTALTVRPLLADLHAAGWRHSIDYEEPTRDWETGAPENEGWRVHRWTRGDATIEVWQSHDDGSFIGSIMFDPAGSDNYMIGDTTDRVDVGVGWAQQHGVDGLRGMAKALGMFAGERGGAGVR